MVDGWCDDERDTSGPVFASDKDKSGMSGMSVNIFKEIHNHLLCKNKSALYNEATYVEYEYEPREKRPDDYDIMEAEEVDADADADADADVVPVDANSPTVSQQPDVKNAELLEVVKYAYV